MKENSIKAKLFTNFILKWCENNLLDRNNLNQVKNMVQV